MRAIAPHPRIPILALAKHMTDAGSSPKDVRATVARAKQINAGGAPRVASIAGSTPEQIRRAMAAARTAAKKVTITTTTIVDDGEDDEDEPVIADAEDDDVDGKDERKKPAGNTDDDDDDDDDTKKDATLSTLQRDVAKLRREATARAAGYSSHEGKRAAEDAIWRKMRLDPAAVRASLANGRASSRAPIGSPAHVQGTEADRGAIRDAAKQGAKLSPEHVKMLRKMGHDDAGIAAIAAKLAKGPR